MTKMGYQHSGCPYWANVATYFCIIGMTNSLASRRGRERGSGEEQHKEGLLSSLGSDLVTCIIMCHIIRI